MTYHYEQTTRQTQRLRYGLIPAMRMLHSSATEVAQEVTTALRENLALEGEEDPLCPICFYPWSEPAGCACPQSPRRTALEEETWDSDFHRASDAEEPLARVADAAARLGGLRSLLRVQVHHADVAIGDFLIDSLDGYGLLPGDITTLAATACGVSEARVARVLDTLQAMDPPGIGARSARECLLAQLAALREEGLTHPLAERLVRECCEDLATTAPVALARRLGERTRAVEAALAFIRGHLYPFPANGFTPDLELAVSLAAPLAPDVVIQRAGHTLSVEVTEERRWGRIRVAPLFIGDHGLARGALSRQVDEAASLVRSLHQRWQTLRRVTEAICRYQYGFITRGPSAQTPLTRRQVAEHLGLHETTIGRAVEGKYALLPDGRLVAFAVFFDDVQHIKAALTTLIRQEDGRHPLSDEQVAERLRDQYGYVVTRRSLAKYRASVGIPPAAARSARLAR